MDLKDDFASGLTVSELPVATPLGAFEEVSAALVAAGDLPESARQSLRDAFIEREREGTTAFGDGFCIPHVIHPEMKRLRVVALRHRGGIDMRSLDGELTEVFCCIAAPESERERYNSVLKHVAKIAQDRKWRTLILQNEGEDICGILAEATVGE